MALPQTPDGVFTVAVANGQPKEEATLYIDRYRGDVLADIRYRDYGRVPKLVEHGIALHQGQLFGVANPHAPRIMRLRA